MSAIIWISLTLALAGGQIDNRASTVLCPAHSPVVRNLKMVERWRIPKSEEEGLLMGYVSPLGVARMDDTIFLLDSQLNKVFVFGLDGELIRTIVREGDGPGEVHMARQLEVLPDRSLAILHGLPCKLTFVGIEGEHRGDWQLSGFVASARLKPSSNGWFGAYETIDLQRSTPDIQRRVFRLARHDDDGRIIQCYIERELVENLRTPKPNEARDYLPWKTWAVSESGNLIIGDDRDSYRFRWIGEDGEILRVVEREFPAYRRTADDLDKVKKSYSPHGSEEAVLVPGDYCTNEPVLSEIRRMADGRLLVETSFSKRDLPAGVIYRFEVHKPTGELEASVRIHQTGDFDPKLDEFVLAGDKLVVLRNLHSAFRSAEAQGIPADLREQDLPDEREDLFFSVVVFDLVEMH